jgi:hypothetical protein
MLVLLAQNAELNFYQAATEAELPTAVNSPDVTGRGFAQLISSAMGGIMIVASLLLLFYLLWGGLEWIYAGGEASKIQKARDKMTQAVIGIIVLATSVAIFGLVQSFLGIDAVNFETRGSNSAIMRDARGRANDLLIR